MCESTKANFWLRTVKQELTEGFAERHDASVWKCLSNILGTPQASYGAQVIATLALCAGGLGFTSAHRVRRAAHFASWTDSLSMVRKRHPNIKSMIMHLEVGGVPGLRAARECRELVDKAGLAMPSWAELSVSPWATNIGPVWWCTLCVPVRRRCTALGLSVSVVASTAKCPRLVTLSGMTIARAEGFSLLLTTLDCLSFCTDFVYDQQKRASLKTSWTEGTTSPNFFSAFPSSLPKKKEKDCAPPSHRSGLSPTLQNQAPP